MRNPVSSIVAFGIIIVFGACKSGGAPMAAEPRADLVVPIDSGGPSGGGLGGGGLDPITGVWALTHVQGSALPTSAPFTNGSNVYPTIYGGTMSFSAPNDTVNNIWRECRSDGVWVQKFRYEKQGTGYYVRSTGSAPLIQEDMYLSVGNAVLTWLRYGGIIGDYEYRFSKDVQTTC